MNKYLFLILNIVFSFAINGQILKTTNLNLSTNGRIYDVEYIPTANAYVVVGEFTTINGTSRKNFAYLNSNTLAVIGGNPITTIDGAIRAVCYYTDGTNHYLTIGGEFNTINGNPRESMALFYTSGSLSLSTFSIHNWNYALQDGNGNYDDGVFDLETKGDTLLVGGVIQGINLANYAATSANVFEDNFLALKFNPSANPHPKFSFVPTSPNLFPTNDVGAFSILNTTNKIFVGGVNFPINNGAVQALVHRFTPTLAQDGTYTASSNTRHGFHSLEKLNDTLILATDAGQNGTGAMVSNMIICKQTGNAPSGNAQYAINPMLSGFSGNVWGQDGYNGDLFMFKGTTPTLQRHRLNTALVSSGLDFIQIGTSISVASPGSHSDTSNNVMVVGRYLFLSERGMTTVGGQARAGVAVFCLEPENPLAFVNPDLSVCPDETVTYTIPDVNYETGYKWTYTGTGVQYSINGGAFQNYTVAVMNTTANASSITLKFPLGSTGGTLTVEPYNTCNTTSDYLYAKPQSIAITVNPQPDLTLNADSLWFTCIVDSINLVAQSVTPSVVYEWAYPNVLTPVSSNNTLLIHTTGIEPTIFYPTGNYFIKATNTITGCVKRDSLYIGKNTTPPTITQDSVFSVPTVFDCTTTQMQLNASAGNATIYWTSALDLNTQYPNPHTVFSSSPQNYIAYATSNTNGCKAQQGFQIQEDYTIIAGNLPSHPLYPAVFITDTINCSNQSVLLQCGIDPADPNAAFGTASWVQNGTTDLTLTVADSVGMYQNTNTYQFVTENSQNGCRDTNEVVIFFDLDHPFVVDYAAPTTLNCSVDTMTLIHPLTGGSVTESWLDGAGTPTGSNSLFVNATGDYIYQVQYNHNGCQNFDTVTVVQTSEMYLTGTPDTVVCPMSIATLTVSPVNVSETVSYLWSNGGTDSFTSAIGGTDTLLTVIATTPGGCMGYDTVRVSITAPVQITTAAFMNCGSVSGSLQVINANGGAGSYQYSIDGATFTSSPLFDSLAPGEYTIYVRDVLGCVYSFDDTLNATASAPPMDFIVSTYSGSNDTLAIVNTTVFAGFDATDWLFPAGTTVYFNSDSLALVQLPDTGWFEITLIGYDDTCEYAFSKTIYSGWVSPQYATNYNSVKIQSFIAFPNPTTGTFTIEIVFGKAQNYSIIVTNDLSQPLSGMSATGYGTSVTLPFTFPIGTPPGAYHIHVVSDFDARQFTLILN